MDFFTFFKDIKSIDFPFVTFQWIHFCFLFLVFFMIVFLFRYYRKQTLEKQQVFQKRMAIYFFVEEMVYSVWLLRFCHERLYYEIIPLQLCSLCVYVAIAAVYFKREELRFFCGIVGSIAGLVAILYPANLSHLYPAFSYRTINFFMLHGAFILFGWIQLQDKLLLSYHHIKRCTLLLSSMLALAFTVNIIWQTDYMFLGNPSSIGLIALLHQFTGSLLFLPCIILIVTLIQFFALFMIRKILVREA